MRVLRFVIASALAATMLSAGRATNDATVLVAGGQSQYRIVIAAARPGQIVSAAQDLQRYLRRATGATLEIVDDSQPMPEHAILLGRSDHLAALGIDPSVENLGTSGYIIRTVSPHLVIAGARGLSTRFAVYGFLEDQVGCRWFAPDCDYVPPRRSELLIWPLDEQHVPAFDCRDLNYEALSADPDFAIRLRLNGLQWKAGWGLWWHTLHHLVPPGKYFADHPEYFALVNGRRVDNQQICTTEPGVFDIVASALAAKMAKNPRWKYFMVSQTDKRGVCEHDACKRLNERAGSDMGATLDLVNRVADRFPDKTICTLAYWTTRKPPEGVRPRDNVLVMIGAGGGDRGYSFIERHPTLVSDIEGWTAICKTVFIWDYVVHYGQLMLPFPNLRALGPNMAMYEDKGVQGVFAQASPEVGGEFRHLRAYLLARLMWDPDQDAEAIIDEFVAGYYGPAAGPIGRYIDDMHDELATSERLSYLASPDLYKNGFLSAANLQHYSELFDQAEQTVAGDAVLLRRVQEARMPVMYARLLLKVGTKAERREIADTFFALADELGIEKLDQWNYTVARFKRTIYAGLN